MKKKLIVVGAVCSDGSYVWRKVTRVVENTVYYIKGIKDLRLELLTWIEDQEFSCNMNTFQKWGKVYDDPKRVPLLRNHPYFGPRGAPRKIVEFSKHGEGRVYYIRGKLDKDKHHITWDKSKFYNCSEYAFKEWLHLCQ